MDTIFISGLKTQAIIGIYDWERAQPQPLIFDLEMQVAVDNAARSDHIKDTVDYKKVADEITASVEKSRYELLESLCEDLCVQILEHYQGVQALQLKVHKPQAVPQADSVGLILNRSRS